MIVGSKTGPVQVAGKGSYIRDRGGGRTKKEAWPGHSRLVGGSFAKQRNLQDLSWAPKWVDLHTTHRYFKGLNRVQLCILSWWSQQHMALSRQRSRKWFPLWKWWAECTVQGQGKCEKLLIARIQLKGQPVVTSSWWPTPNITNKERCHRRV